MSEQQIQKVKVKRLAHVGLWSTDVFSQGRFYRQILGFHGRNSGRAVEQQVDLEDASVFIALGDEHHCLGLFNDTRPTGNNGRAPQARSRLHHLSFEVDTDAELAALAARLNQAGIELSLEERDGESELGDTLWFHDPDSNRVEISVAPDDYLASSATYSGTHTRLRPFGLQHVALRTPHLDAMVEFYCEALGFDSSDWLLRECAWLRCNSDHHTLTLIQGDTNIDHIGLRVEDGPELFKWADHLSRHQTPVLWGPGRHGAGNDLFLRLADVEGVHIELSAELLQYYDRDVTTPPRLWHTRTMAHNLWGVLPAWMREEVRI
jgi:catechol 2,3-dioxygenase-like lactoylglutathione lyase family enzyme